MGSVEEAEVEPADCDGIVEETVRTLLQEGQTGIRVVSLLS